MLIGWDYIFVETTHILLTKGNFFTVKSGKIQNFMHKSDLVHIMQKIKKSKTINQSSRKGFSSQFEE